MSQIELKPLSLVAPETFPEREWLVAYHEAGHAVVANNLGARVTEVVATNEDDESSGHVNFNFSSIKDDVARIDCKVLTPLNPSLGAEEKSWIVRCAGGVAEVLGGWVIGTSISRDYLLDDMKYDRKDMDEQAVRMEEGFRLRWVDHRYAETWAMVLMFQAEIEAVAVEALSRAQPLTQSDLTSILNEYHGWQLADGGLPELEAVRSTAALLGHPHLPDIRSEEEEVAWQAKSKHP